MSGIHKIEVRDRQAIGESAFVIRETVLDHVLLSLRDQLKSLEGFNSPNGDDQRFAAFRISQVKEQIDSLSRPPEVVIAEAKALYDKASKLAKRGANVDVIARDLSAACPNFESIYPLLARTEWGAILGPRILQLQEFRQARS